MAHKSLVGGTAYGIKGGKCLVGGTAYSIKKGRTLVGGTGYNILFASIPVTVTGKTSVFFYYIKINGAKWPSTINDIMVSPGDVISFYMISSSRYNGWVSVNGEEYTAKVSGGNTGTYNWTVPNGCKSITVNIAYNNSSTSTSYSRYTVTTK